jgi:hypothetical protein
MGPSEVISVPEFLKQKNKITKSVFLAKSTCRYVFKIRDSHSLDSSANISYVPYTTSAALMANNFNLYTVVCKMVHKIPFLVHEWQFSGGQG